MRTTTKKGLLRERAGEQGAGALNRGSGRSDADANTPNLELHGNTWIRALPHAVAACVSNNIILEHVYLA